MTLHAELDPLRRLVIDDMRIFDFDALYARSSADALKVLADAPSWHEVWWDWDLGGMDRRDTVEPVMRWFEERWATVPLSTLEVDVHFIVTDNPHGRLVLRVWFDRWEIPYVVMSGRVPFRIVDRRF